MSFSRIKGYLTIFLILTVIGFIAHFQTLKFALFGDDWQAIYWYLSQETSGGYFANLPGLLKYLTQYGGQLLLTGISFNLFGYIYFYYYLVSLLFKILAAFTLFLLIRKLTEDKQKTSNNLTSFLSSTLLLVGFTGIQTTDFVVQMGVFLSAALSFLSIYFLYEYILSKSKIAGVSCVFSGILAIIIAPIRLFPFIFIFPLSAILLSQTFNPKKRKLPIFIILFTWLLLIYLLWYIGLFSAPGQISSSYTSQAKNFLNTLKSHPLPLLFNLLQWLGAVIIPDQITPDKNLQQIIGFIFIATSAFTFYLIRKEKEKLWKLLTAAVPLIFFYILMFVYSSARQISSDDRYLIMIFYGFCLFFAVATINLSKSVNKIVRKFATFLIVFLLILNILHLTSLQKIYNRWLINGRSAYFISKTEEIFYQDFSHPFSDAKIIFLDFDNTQTLYYIQYGLDFKLLVFTRTFKREFFPQVIIDKSDIIKIINKASLENKQKIFDNLYSYSLRNERFFNSTESFKKNIQSAFNSSLEDI